MATQILKFLIVDDEPDLRELLVLILGAKFTSQFFEASNGLEAIRILENEAAPIHIIISDFNMPKANGATLARYVREKMPNVPFVLMTSDDRREHEDILSQPLTSYFEKPFEEARLVGEVDRLLTGSSSQRTTVVPDFVPISINSLARLKTAECPVYIKLSEGHFVKVLGEQALFEEAFLKRFADKGITYLYLEKKDFPRILTRYRELVQNDLYISALKGKKGEVFQLSKSIQELIKTATKTFGWDSETLALGSDGIRLIQNLTKYDTSLAEVFDWFSDDSHDAGLHTSILLTYILAKMCRHLKFSSPRAFDHLSMAAFFHDLPLSDHLIRNQRKFLKTMELGLSANKNEIEQIKNHAHQAKEIISQWPHCPTEVLQIIERHTERPDGKGFPKGLKANDLDELSGAFIVANEVVQLYLHNRDRETLFSELSSMSKVFGQALVTREAYAVVLAQLSR